MASPVNKSGPLGHNLVTSQPFIFIFFPPNPRLNWMLRFHNKWLSQKLIISTGGKIMHNSSHVCRAAGQFIPKRWAQESALGVVNHRQHVDALPDKYDNCRASWSYGPASLALTYDFMDARTFRAGRCGEEKNRELPEMVSMVTTISIDWLCAHVAKTNCTGRVWGRSVRLLALGSNSCCFIFSQFLQGVSTENLNFCL